jgi:UbiD family decarboxylase
MCYLIKAEGTRLRELGLKVKDNLMNSQTSRVVHYRSLREHIAALRAIGELHEIDQEVDWNLEIGAIVRRIYETGGPAVLFNRIKGTEPGFRVLGAPAGASARVGQPMARVATSIGLEPTATALEIAEALARAHDLAPIPPRRVASAPCKQNILTGAAVDLTRLPAPFIHQHDGGRFLNTWGTTVTRTPEGDWTNWAISRTMLHDKSSMVGPASSSKHIGVMLAAWKAVGKSMPFALSLGHDPIIPFVAGMPLADGVNEADFIGGYLGEPLEVVKCETVDLDVPASSEIVIEGHVMLDQVGPEGPMAEFPGYLFPKDQHLCPVFRVTALTFRSDPILPVISCGTPPEENHTCWGIAIAASVLAELRHSNWPVTACFLPFDAACHLMVITVPRDYLQLSPEKTNTAFCKAIAEFVFRLRGGAIVPRLMIACDDIDPSNTREVLWALMTRCHPGTGEMTFPHLAANPRDAFLRVDEKAAMFTTKAVFNCLPREEWEQDQAPIRASFDRLYPTDLQARILRDWKTGYGLP